jgi:hypothetical protein
MFFPIFSNNRIFNQQLRNKCLNSTNKSIQKMVETLNKRENKIVVSNLIQNNEITKNNYFVPLIYFLSTSTYLVYILFKRKFVFLFI